MPANKRLAGMARSYICSHQPFNYYLYRHLSCPLSSSVLLTGESRYFITERLP